MRGNSHVRFLEGLGTRKGPWPTRLALDLRALPGGDLVEEGLSDLARGIESIPALLAHNELQSQGIELQAVTGPEEVAEAK